jgi:hypothetical protein
MGPRGVGLLHCKPWRGAGVHVLAYRGFALTGARPRAVLQDTGGRHVEAPADRGVGVARFDVARFGIIGCGGVPEWLIGAVSKTVVRLWRTVGSNPTPSATAPFGISKWLEHTVNLQPPSRNRAEGCQSGRLGTPGKRVYPSGYRGFESHPLRHALLFRQPPVGR